MASYTFNLPYSTYSAEFVINFLTLDKGKKIPLKLLLDTGATHTIIATKYAQQLGINNLKSGTVWEVFGQSGHEHYVVMQIGTLTPIAVNVIFVDSPVADRGADLVGVLGWTNALSKYSTTLTTSTLTFTELPKTVLKNVKIIRRFNNIIVL